MNAYVNARDDGAGLLTKVITSGEKRKDFAMRVFRHVNGDRCFSFLFVMEVNVHMVTC